MQDYSIRKDGRDLGSHDMIGSRYYLRDDPSGGKRNDRLGVRFFEKGEVGVYTMNFSAPTIRVWHQGRNIYIISGLGVNRSESFAHVVRAPTAPVQDNGHVEFTGELVKTFVGGVSIFQGKNGNGREYYPGTYELVDAESDAGNYAYALSQGDATIKRAETTPQPQARPSSLGHLVNRLFHGGR